MAHTYSTPESRAQARQRRSAALDLELILLAAASLLLVGAMWIVGAAANASIDETSARLASGTAVDLNTLATAEALAPQLVVFGDPRERLFVAREVVDFVSGGGTGPTSRRTLANVGALSRITVDARRIRTTTGLTTLQTRLREMGAPRRHQSRAAGPLHIGANRLVEAPVRRARPRGGDVGDPLARGRCHRRVPAGVRRPPVAASPLAIPSCCRRC